MNTAASRRRRVLIALLKLQALIGAGFLLWIFFAGDRVEEKQASTPITIDTANMAIDSFNIVAQKNHDLVVIRPSPAALRQLATLAMPVKTTASEPPPRDYRVSAAIKVFAVVRIDDHYLLSGRDHWQRDQVCDRLELQSGVEIGGQKLAIALVCRQANRFIVYDGAGRSLQADIADLEMPLYVQQDTRVHVTAP